MGVAHYHRPWTWFVGASVFLSRTRSPTFKPGSISHLSLLHLSPAFKRIRILNLGLCLLGTDSCKSWSLFCDGIHQIGDAYHMRNAPKAIAIVTLLPTPPNLSGRPTSNYRVGKSDFKNRAHPTCHSCVRPSGKYAPDNRCLREIMGGLDRWGG